MGKTITVKIVSEFEFNNSETLRILINPLSLKYEKKRS